MIKCIRLTAKLHFVSEGDLITINIIPNYNISKCISINKCQHEENETGFTGSPLIFYDKYHSSLASKTTPGNSLSHILCVGLALNCQAKDVFCLSFFICGTLFCIERKTKNTFRLHLDAYFNLLS